MDFWNLKKLAERLKVPYEGNPEQAISSIATLEDAKEGDLCFFAHERYKERYLKSKASTFCVSPHAERREGKNFLISTSPSDLFQQILLLFRPKIEPYTSVCHHSCWVHPKAKIGKNVVLGAFCVIEEGVTIGDNSVIGPHVVLARYAQVGKNAILHAHAVVREGCILDEGVILQPGAIIGSCGFGFTPQADGTHKKQEQTGYVHIESFVEVGACTTIDRARVDVTRIGKGSKIDNLVQIAHGVETGESCLITSQVGIAGSTKLGDRVVIGGQSGFNGHIKIASDTFFQARSAIAGDIKESGVYGGAPAIPVKESNRQVVFLRTLQKRLARLSERISLLEKNLL